MSLSTKSLFLTLLFILFVGLLIAGCSDDGPTGPRFDDVQNYDISAADSSFTTEDGLTVYIIEKGHGIFEVIPRDEIQVRYTGRTKDGKIFESTFRNGITAPGILRNLTPQPIPSQSGQPISPLIDGFRRGLLGMIEGEKRKIIIPPNLGYGESRRGTNGYDLRNDTLYFDVELVNIL